MNDNVFDQLRAAIQQQRDLKRAVENNANTLAGLLDGNLRLLSDYHLKRFKKELSDYNMHTEKWK